MFGGADDITQTTRQEIPEELKPYVTKAIEALTGAISMYPITPLYQFQPRPIVQPSAYQNLLAAQLMTMPFGGISPYLSDISVLFPTVPTLPKIWDTSSSAVPLGIENLLTQIEALRREIEALRMKTQSPLLLQENYW